MTKQEKSAGAIIYYIDEEPFFLFLENTLKTTYWEFPKGKIEENEKIEETVKREVKEETTLENFEMIKGFKHILRWFYKFQNEIIHKEAVYLLVKIKKEEAEKVKINLEHQKFKWMTFEEAMKEVKIKSNREMLEKAFKFIKEHEKQKTLI